MADYCTLAQVKEYFGYDASKDAIITANIPRVTAVFNTALDRDLSEVEYTELYDGRGNPILFLNQRPVSEVDSVKEDGVLVDAGDYTVYPEGFIKLNEDLTSARSRWPMFVKGNRNYEVVYTAGYDPVPADVSLAAIQMVGYLIESSSNIAGTIKSEKIGNYSYTLQGQADKAASSKEGQRIIPVDVWSLISRYARRDYQSTRSGT